MIVIIATPKLFQWACHCRWLYTYTMLVPHFWQVWVFLTPPTDVAGLGALGESFPGNRRAASGVKHKHTHTLTLTQLLTGTFWQSLCSSHQHSVCLHRSLSAELVCVSPLVFTSSAPEGHASWNGFPHIGHYHFMKECRCYLDVFAQPFIKAEGGKGGHMHFMICCSQHKRHTGELFSTSCTGDGHMEVQVRSQLLALACSALERRLMIIFFSNYFHYWLIVCCLIVQSFSAENCEERSSHSPRVWTDSCFYVQPTV